MSRLKSARRSSEEGSCCLHPSSHSSFTLFYGKFRMHAPRIRALMGELEARKANGPDYQTLLDRESCAPRRIKHVSHCLNFMGSAPQPKPPSPRYHSYILLTLPFFFTVPRLLRVLFSAALSTHSSQLADRHE
jgi:hypothetical protein